MYVAGYVFTILASVVKSYLTFYVFSEILLITKINDDIYVHFIHENGQRLESTLSTVLSHASIANFPNLDFVFFFEKFMLF